MMGIILALIAAAVLLVVAPAFAVGFMDRRREARELARREAQQYADYVREISGKPMTAQEIKDLHAARW
jgi:protein-S-isoprenylcysteine O-methyltransferase Ste14